MSKQRRKAEWAKSQGKAPQPQREAASQPEPEHSTQPPQPGQVAPVHGTNPTGAKTVAEAKK